ncbi:MAG: SURF1 family protein [Rhodanobacteraceae bacterium]
MIRLRRPSPFAVALTFAGFAIFVALGVWQLRRADQKESLLARFAQAAHAPLQPLSAVQENAPPTSYPHVIVHGRFDARRVYLLDDQTHADRLGIEAFVPFTPDNRGNALLVNLGFLPREGIDQSLPQLPPIPERELTLTGIYAPPPRAGLKLGGNPLPRQHAWPKLVTWIDLHDIGADLHRATYPRVLLLDADPASVYVRQWAPDTMPPARHRAYALQWFTFALIALVMFFVLHRVRDERAP